MRTISSTAASGTATGPEKRHGLFTTFLAAARVAGAVDARRRPSRADLRILGIETDLF